MLRLGGLEFVDDVRKATYTLANYSRKVGMRREGVARPYAVGSFPAPGFLAEQEFTWSGLVLTDSEYEQQHAIQRLASLLAGGGLSRLVIDDAGGPRWVDVQREEIPEPTVLVPGRVASYQVSVSAPNPRLYGESRQFAAGEPAFHYGNFAATPRLLIGAGSGGYTVTGPGGRQIVVGTAPAGAHYIDFANGGLFTNAGVRQVGAVTVYQPWTVPVGMPGVSASITGSRSLSQRVTDTYV